MIVSGACRGRAIDVKRVCHAGQERSKGHKTDTDGKGPYRLYQFCVLLTSLGEFHDHSFSVLRDFFPGRVVMVSFDMSS